MSSGCWTSQLQGRLFLHVVLFTANELKSLTEVSTVLSCQHAARTLVLYLLGSWQNLDKHKSQIETPAEVWQWNCWLISATLHTLSIRREMYKQFYRQVSWNLMMSLQPRGERAWMNFVLCRRFYKFTHNLLRSWDRKINWNQVLFMLKPCL